VMSWKLERVRAEAVEAIQRRAVHRGGRGVLVRLMGMWRCQRLAGRGGEEVEEEEATVDDWLAGQVGC